jgi:type I restriction enzyme, S subunit
VTRESLAAAVYEEGKLTPELALPQFLEAALLEQGTQEKIDAIKTGISDSGLNLTHDRFRALNLNLAPLPEQVRIVEALESYLTRIDDAIATLARVQRSLKGYRASVLKAAVEGRLVPTEAEIARAECRNYEPATKLLDRILAERRRRWDQSGRKGRYEEPAGPDAADLPSLPEGWCWSTADQLTDGTRAITYGVIKLGVETEAGIPVLRSSNVRQLLLDLDYVKPIAPAIEAEYARTRLRGGEVVVTVRGTLGGVAVVPSVCAGHNVSREVAVLALVEDRLAQAVAYFIGSGRLQTWMLTRTKGIAYTGVNIETLKRLPVPLPPLAECSRIADKVGQLLSIGDSVCAAGDAEETRLARLRQSILKWAFEGKLVDQDPSDEPASVLLERSKAKRAADALATKPRGKQPRAKVTR